MSGKLSTRVGLILAAILAAGFLAIGVMLMLRTEMPPNRPALLMLHWFGVRDAFLGFFALILILNKEFRAVRLFILCSLLLPLVDVFILAPFWGMATAARFNAPYLIVIGIVYFFLHLGKSVEAKVSAPSAFGADKPAQRRSA